MGLVVNTNIASINAQRQLSSSGADLDQASERLASGKRINSAADDAAGLAIANRQTSQIRGLDQAIRNANDGISLIQTAEGALDATSNILQRVRELSVQSANGIYSDNDRATLDAEVKQLTSELDRIAESTAFNGQKILDGSLGTLKLQVGAEAGDTIDLEVQGFSAAELGGAAGGGDVIGTAAATGADLLTGLQAIVNTSDDTLTINDQAVSTMANATTLQEALDVINTSVSGVEASAFVEATLGDSTTTGNGILTGSERVSFAILGQNGSTTTIEVGNTGSLQDVADSLNAQAGTLVQASVNDDGRLQLASESAALITIGETGSGVAAAAVGSADTTAFNASLSFELTSAEPGVVENATAGGSPTVNSVDITLGDDVVGSTIGIQTRSDGDVTGELLTATAAATSAGDLIINGVAIGGVASGAANAGAQGDALVVVINAQSAATGVVATNASGILSLDSVDGSEISIEFAEANAAATFAATGLIETNASNSQGGSVADINISTQTGATAAIEVVDLALEQINSQRADLGAINNRLDFTVSNLSNVSENTSAARSRIMDADFASETAELSRAQVLQQASQAILAQANARPQQVLSLLN
jgi:flagellin